MGNTKICLDKTKKWGALMLPEHLQALKKWKKEFYKESPKQLSSWELDDLQQTISLAVKQQQVIKLTIWENDRYIQQEGIIQYINSYERELTFCTLSQIKKIKIDYIYEAHTDGINEN
ncbi:YolD-like family protein [Lysinibacillus sp. OL1]|uniref:YolD-like family protein n=1 Tax=Lysinibacillus sp. OL1 TaxID=2517243 RepID=UPI00187D53CD|nr:YolD-like family protein [Lysinibacillus sp. OL1]